MPADQPAVDTLGTVSMSASNPSPIVTKALRFEDLPPGSRVRRRPHRQNQEQLRSVHFRRDLDWLQS